MVCRFVDLDTPLLLSEDPVLEGYEGIILLKLTVCLVCLVSMVINLIFDHVLFLVTSSWSCLQIHKC